MGIDDILETVNRCQIMEMERGVKTLDPEKPESGVQFSRQVLAVQAVIIHMYQLTAFAALKEADAARAAAAWRTYLALCDTALVALRAAKDKFPYCGTLELYDLTLDYRSAAHRRYHQNSQDAECQKIEVPENLFPKPS